MRKTPEQIFDDLKQQKYFPVYFLYGDEPYYIDQITNSMLERILREEEKAFNQHIFYGKDTPVSTITDTSRRFPMMADHQLVVVKEAQQLQNLELLAPYLESPQPSTILVLCYKHKTIDKRKKIFQLLDKKSISMESARIREHRLPAWIIQYGKEKELSIDIKSATLLSEFLGSDLEKIEKEIEKLLLILPKEKRVLTPDIIEKFIGFSKEHNHFELTNALSNRDIGKATRIIHYFCNNQNAFPIQVTMGYLYFYFTKLLTFHAVQKKSKDEIARQLKIHPYFIGEYQKAAGYYTVKRLEKVFAVLRDIDLKSKGIGNVSATACELLKEMIYKIMHV